MKNLGTKDYGLLNCNSLREVGDSYFGEEYRVLEYTEGLIYYIGYDRYSGDRESGFIVDTSIFTQFKYFADYRCDYTIFEKDYNDGIVYMELSDILLSEKEYEKVIGKESFDSYIQWKDLKLLEAKIQTEGHFPYITKYKEAYGDKWLNYYMPLFEKRPRNTIIFSKEPNYYLTKGQFIGDIERVLVEYGYTGKDKDIVYDYILSVTLHGLYEGELRYLNYIEDFTQSLKHKDLVLNHIVNMFRKGS